MGWGQPRTRLSRRSLLELLVHLGARLEEVLDQSFVLRQEAGVVGRDAGAAVMGGEQRLRRGGGSFLQRASSRLFTPREPTTRV